MIIAVDFDGTCVTHKYPAIGEDIGAGPVLREIVENGHKIILYTMRSGKQLEEAVDWFDVEDIDLYGVNKNPTQEEWTKSPKAYANLYIDDAALGVPLIFPKGERPHVNWGLVKYFLESNKIISKED